MWSSLSHTFHLVSLYFHCTNKLTWFQVQSLEMCCFSWDHEIGLSGSSLSNKSVRMKAYQITKHNTIVYNTVRQNFTTLVSYHGANLFMVCCDNLKVKSINVVLTFLSNIAGKCACTCSVGQHSPLPRDTALQHCTGILTSCSRDVWTRP